MEITKRDLGQILLGAVMLLLGVSFLWFERDAMLHHIPIFFKSWIMYPWQAISAGGLWSALGLFLIADAIWLRGRTLSARETPVAIAAVMASATSAPLIYWFHIRFLFFSLAAYHVFDVPPPLTGSAGSRFSRGRLAQSSSSGSLVLFLPLSS